MSEPTNGGDDMGHGASGAPRLTTRQGHLCAAIERGDFPRWERSVRITPDWEREDLVRDLIDLLGRCERQIQERMVGLSGQCDADHGARVAAGLGLPSPVVPTRV